MNKKVVVLLLVGLFVVTSIFATQTRMSGLGNPYGLVEDDTDVFTYPATIFKYSGVAVGELNQLGGSTSWSMAANIPIMKYKLGVYINQDTGINLPGYDMALNISKSVEFNFGLIDYFAFGLGTSIDYRPEIVRPLSGSEEFRLEPSANFHSFFAGYSANDIDFGLRISMANAKDVNSDDDHLEMNNTTLEVNARKFMFLDPRLDLIFKAGFAMEMSEFNYKTLRGVKIVDLEASEMIIDLGFSLQVKPNEKNKIILGITPIIYNPASVEKTYYSSSATSKEEEERNLIFFPEYNLGVESKINSWLTGRMGAKQSYAHVTEIENFNSNVIEDTEDTYYDKQYHMNLGLTFSFGNFCVDSVLEQDLLFDGPNFLGGKSNGLASQISVKYQF